MLGDKFYPYLSEFLRCVAEAGRIELGDVRAIRVVLEEEVAISREIIETLIELDRAAEGGEEWRDFLAATVVDYCVWVEGSLGSVSGDTADWLVAALRGEDGNSAPSAAPVIRAIIAEADSVDPALCVFALSAASLPAHRIKAPTHQSPAYIM